MRLAKLINENLCNVSAVALTSRNRSRMEAAHSALLRRLLPLLISALITLSQQVFTVAVLQLCKLFPAALQLS